MRIAAYCLAALCLAGAPPVQAGDKSPPQQGEDVTWILAEFPPLFVNEPALAGQGYGEKQLKFLTSRLPDFHHAILNGTGSRLWHEIERRDGVCTLSVAKLPEREKFAVFSARSFWGTTNQVIVRTDRLAKMTPFL